MRSPNLRLTSLAIALLVAAPGFASPAKEEVSKPIKTVIQAVRFNKDPLALKNFAGEEQGKLLLADDWSKGTEAQRKEFITLFHSLFSQKAFPNIRKNLENLDTVLYDEPTVSGEKAEIGSTILINHPLKKQELKAKYQLVKDKTGWKVVDVSVLGDSMLKGIRDPQIIDIMKEGGWEKLLALMRSEVKKGDGAAKK